MDILVEGEYPQLKIIGTRIVKRDDGNDAFEVWLRDLDNLELGITDYLYTSSKKAFDFTCRRLTSYGWDPKENGYAFSVLGLDGEGNPLEGATVGPVTITAKTYQGKIQYRVGTVGDEQPFAERMAPEEAREAEARIRAKYGLAAAATGRRKPPPQSALPADAGSDPF